MTLPVVLFLAVAPNPDAILMAEQAAAVCTETMRPSGKGVVRLVPSLPSDADLAADEVAVGATAVVILTWRDADFLTTDVRLGVGRLDAQSVEWLGRTVAFGPNDLPLERGRALGFVVASMLQGRVKLTVPEEKAPPSTEEARQERASTPASGTLTASPSTDTPALPPPVDPRWSFEAGLTTFLDGFSGLDFDAAGGTFALRRRIWGSLALRAGLGFQVAGVDGADATRQTTSAAIGIAWKSQTLGRPHAVGFGARFDLLGLHDEVRLSGQGSSASEALGYWSLGGDLLGQMGYGLSDGTSLLVSGGLEETLTAADVIVAGRTEATVSRGHPVVELGVLSRF